MITKDEENDPILTCMVEHVMSTPANDFGFEDPPAVCWAPAFDNMGVVRLESLVTRGPPRWPATIAKTRVRPPNLDVIYRLPLPVSNCLRRKSVEYRNETSQIKQMNSSKLF
jgi:hypothetical protein